MGSDHTGKGADWNDCTEFKELQFLKLKKLGTV